MKSANLLVFAALLLFGCCGLVPSEKQCIGDANPYCSGDVRYHDAYCDNGRWLYQMTNCPHGCANGDCVNPSCPESCDDENPCTNDVCSSATGYICYHEPLTGTHIGCTGISHCQQSTCAQGTCVSTPFAPCCGNAECEVGETYATCSADCAAPAPRFNVIIEGCTTGYDVSHGLGEVTNVYVRIQNIGNADASGVRAITSASDEGQRHPDKEAVIGEIPAGYERVAKMTVDSTYQQSTLITVDVSSSQGVTGRQQTNQCSQIDQQTVQGLETLIQIVSGIPI